MSEYVEFKKGDQVRFTWGLDKRIFKIALKPKKKHGIFLLTLEDDKGVRQDCLAQWCVHV